VQSVENSKGEFPPLPTALANPADRAGFPHSHSADGGFYIDTTFKLLPLCLGQEFREGNASPGAGILEFAERCEGALAEGKRIYFRSDSAAYQAEVINHYSQPGRSFTITADLDAAVKREIAHLPGAAWAPYRRREG
jgi:hypothetical protein